MTARAHGPVLVLLLVAPVAAQGTLHFVGPDGSGAPFDQIQPAVDAASPGDTVLVAAGTYLEFTLSKAVNVIGEGADQVVVGTELEPCDPMLGPCPPVVGGSTGVTIAGIGFADQVVVSGLTAVGFSDAVQERPGVLVTGCAGTLTLHDVRAQGSTEHQEALRVELSSRVWLSRCELLGHESGSADSVEPAKNAPAVIVQSSNVRIVDSDLHGGDGDMSSSQAGGALGEPGLRLTGSVAYLARARVSGGDSGLQGVGPGASNLPGADAVESFGSLIHVVGGRGNGIVGGAPANDAPGGGAPELAGAGIDLQLASIGDVTSFAVVEGEPPIAVDPTSVLGQPATIYPTLGTLSPSVTPGGAFTVAFDGHPGGTAALFLALALAPDYFVPGYQEVGVLDLGMGFFLSTHTLNAAGLASTVLAVPPSPAFLGLTAWLQFAELGVPQPTMSNPALVVVTG